MLAEAGFFPRNPDDILCESILLPRDTIKITKPMHYNWKIWARTYGIDGRLPAFTAAARSLKWVQMEEIFTVNMPVVQEIDVLTGLPLFMLAAAGPTSDTESIYNLLKEYPSAMSLVNQGHQNSFTDSIRKEIVVLRSHAVHWDI